MYQQMVDTYQLSGRVTRPPTRKGKNLIDHISSNINKGKIVHYDILPCPGLSNRDAPYNVINVLRKKFKIS